MFYLLLYRAGKREIREFLTANPSFPHDEQTVFNKVMNGVMRCERLATKQLGT